MARDWSRAEVEAIVSDYFAMLSMELAGTKFNKAARNRALLAQLDERKRTAVEFKHANISHILSEWDYPIVNGYKPRSNAQRMLGEVVLRYIQENPRILETMRGEADRPVAPPPRIGDDGLLSKFEEPPPPPPPPTRVRSPRSGPPLPPIDYFERERRNQSIGDAGEEFAVRIERARLRSAGKDSLAAKVERVSVTEGDSAGYDIRSYETNGKDRLIEVKSTISSRYSPFFVSAHELRFSLAHEDEYHLYRVHSLRREPRLFVLPGRISAHCKLDPVNFRATFGWAGQAAYAG